MKTDYLQYKGSFVCEGGPICVMAENKVYGWSGTSNTEEKGDYIQLLEYLDSGIATAENFNQRRIMIYDNKKVEDILLFMSFARNWNVLDSNYGFSIVEIEYCPEDWNFPDQLQFDIVEEYSDYFVNTASSLIVFDATLSGLEAVEKSTGTSVNYIEGRLLDVAILTKEEGVYKIRKIKHEDKGQVLIEGIEIYLE